jgi:hypothetical protein
MGRVTVGVHGRVAANPCVHGRLQGVEAANRGSRRADSSLRTISRALDGREQVVRLSELGLISTMP